MNFINAILVAVDTGVRTPLENEIQRNSRTILLQSFSSAQSALLFAQENAGAIDLAVLEIGLPDGNGIELAEELKRQNPQMLFIFVTEYEEFALRAYRLKAVDYILKPFCAQDISYALESAYLLRQRSHQVIYAKTFGHFDLFVNEWAVPFKSAKAKELLALLIDCQGGVLNSDQVISILWQDRPNDEATQNLASKISKTLKKELEDAGVGGLVEFGRGTRSINLNMFSCDLYDFLNGKEDAKRQYYGEYMMDYEWGEHRIYFLNRLLETK